MKKFCKKCVAEFEITEDDFKFYDVMKVPAPTLCPLCRMQKKMSFRNERNLYKRKCDFSGQEILSVYPITSYQKVYDQKIWWSDQWNALDYGKDYDFNRTFFEQFEDLIKEVPKMNFNNKNNENSDYCNDTNDLKNCYLIFNSEYANDFYYCNTAGYGSDCMDLFWGIKVELCYECSKTMEAYHCFWCFNCAGVSDCYFCENLIGCKNCFGCVGLRQKEYCVYNKQHTREEYENFIKDFSFSYSDIENAKKEVQKLRLTVPFKALEITQSEDCLGDYISNSKNCVECFDILNSENCKYIWDGLAINSHDCFNSGFDSSFLYEGVGIYRSNNVKFSDKSSSSNDLQYCDYCFSCHDCFGCVSLNHKQYCILNKEYKKEEYEKLVAEIIEQMKKNKQYGEFFPPHLSPFGYNDSMAFWYFPLTKEEALKQGFNWNDYQNPKLEMKSISAEKLPETIQNVTDDILNIAIECEKDKKLFKMMPKELAFYRKHNIPLPRLCPDCRHERRKRQMNPRKLLDRNCAKCGTQIKTTYSPDRPEIVYCEKCYLEAVY